MRLQEMMAICDVLFEIASGVVDEIVECSRSAKLVLSDTSDFKMAYSPCETITWSEVRYRKRRCHVDRSEDMEWEVYRRFGQREGGCWGN